MLGHKLLFNYIMSQIPGFIDKFIDKDFILTYNCIPIVDK